MHFDNTLTLMPRVVAPVVATRPPPYTVRAGGIRGLGALELTDALGLGTIAFVVGGAIGFALGAAAVASVR